MGLYQGTKYEYLDEPRQNKMKLCKDCINFAAHDATCRQAYLADPVNGGFTLRNARQVRMEPDGIFSCGLDANWFIPKDTGA